MRTEQLQYLLEVSKRASLNEAAKKLGIAQQSLNESIKKLEEEFGVAILTRAPRGVHLTEDGQVLVEMAKEMLKILNKTKRQLLKEDEAVMASVQSLKILEMPAAHAQAHVSLVNDILKDYPLVDIQIIERNLDVILRDIQQNEQGNILGMVSLRGDEAPLPESIAFFPLLENEFLACVSKYSPLARMQEISIQTLLGYPMVLYNLGELKDNSLYNLLLSYGEPLILLTADNAHFLAEYISCHKCVSIISKSWGKDQSISPNSEIRLIPFKENIGTKMGCIYRNDLALPRITAGFIQRLIKYYR